MMATMASAAIVSDIVLLSPCSLPALAAPYPSLLWKGPQEISGAQCRYENQQPQDYHECVSPEARNARSEENGRGAQDAQEQADLSQTRAAAGPWTPR